MPGRFVPRLLVTTMMAGTTLIALPGPASGVDQMPSVVEDGSYPGAQAILETKGIELVKGDGRITLADCADDAELIKVESIGRNPFCFRVKGDTGWLTLRLDLVFLIHAGDQDVTATVTVGGQQETVNIPEAGVRAVGTTDPDYAALLELRATGGAGTPPPAAPPDTFAAKLDIGGGWRTCSGALVAAQWLVTAASCFTEGDQPLRRGRPARATTATVGRTDLTTGAGLTTAVVELVPRTDRDVVLAKLARPVQGITAPPIAGAAPAAGQTLRAAGYGRTATEWAPDRLHLTDVTVTSGTDTTFEVAPGTCKGDAGGPAYRETAGAVELVAIHSSAWLGGCLAETETRRAGAEVRLDDIRGWIAQTALGFAPAVSWTSNGGRLDVFRVDAGTVRQKFWTSPRGWSTWIDLGAPAAGVASAPAATWTANGSRVDILVAGADGHLYQKYWTSAGWTGWVDHGDTPILAPAASWTGNGSRLEIFGVGADGRLHQRYWSSAGWATATFDLPAAGAIDAPTVTWTTSGSRLDVYVTGADGHLYQKYWTSTGWRPWLDLGGSLLSAPSASWTNNGARVDILGVGVDGQLHQKYWTSAGWTSATFAAPAAGLGSAPSTSWTTNGSRLEIVATGHADGHVYQRYWTSAGWSAWVDLG